VCKFCTWIGPEDQRELGRPRKPGQASPAALHRPLGGGGAAAGAGAATRPRRPSMVASSLAGRPSNAREDR